MMDSFVVAKTKTCFAKKEENPLSESQQTSSSGRQVTQYHMYKKKEKMYNKMTSRNFCKKYFN